MLITTQALTELFGNGGEPYEDLLFELVTKEASKVGISPSNISWDHRVNQGDGGRDIIVNG